MERHRSKISADSVVSVSSTVDKSDSSQNTIFFLGASSQQLAPIKYARQAGFKIITCDNRPHNPGHKLAHRSYNISTTAVQDICNKAEEQKVDAIIAYGTDVGAPTAAWVSERLCLNGNPYNAVITLTDKGKFRQFQKEREYFTPKFLIVNQDRLRNEADLPSQILEELSLPLIVKPVDASGSRGISRAHEHEQLQQALALAAENSRSGDIIIEELIPYVSYQICGEGFLHDGKIIFHAFADEHFTPGILPPVGETFPSSASEEQVQKAVDVLQDIFSTLGMRKGPFNFDLVYLPTGEVFVIEIGPRNGGNRMPEAIANAYGVDMIAATVESALGHDVQLEKQWLRYSATYSVHSKKPGIFERVEYDPKIRPHIVNEQMFVNPGERVQRFSQGSDMLGCLILTFENHNQMVSMMQDMDQLIQVVVNDEDIH